MNTKFDTDIYGSQGAESWSFDFASRTTVMLTFVNISHI